MQFLMDTHAFLWFVSNTKDLSNSAKKIVENEEN